MGVLFEGFVMGLVATIVMDIWALALRRFAGMPLPNWAMLGRWTGHLPSGTVFHNDIAAAAPIRNELGLGWATHYVVGIIYGIFFAVIAGAGWLVEPTFLPVWMYALLTIAAGWFLLQPGYGPRGCAVQNRDPEQRPPLRSDRPYLVRRRAVARRSDRLSCPE